MTETHSQAILTDTPSPPRIGRPPKPRDEPVRETRPGATSKPVRALFRRPQWNIWPDKALAAAVSQEAARRGIDNHTTMVRLLAVERLAELDRERARGETASKGPSLLSVLLRWCGYRGKRPPGVREASEGVAVQQDGGGEGS